MHFVLNSPEQDASCADESHCNDFHQPKADPADAYRDYGNILERKIGTADGLLGSSLTPSTAVIHYMEIRSYTRYIPNSPNSLSEEQGSDNDSQA